MSYNSCRFFHCMINGSGISAEIITFCHALFHIPQVQHYWRGDSHTWIPMIITSPLLLSGEYLLNSCSSLIVMITRWESATCGHFLNFEYFAFVKFRVLFVPVSLLITFWVQSELVIVQICSFVLLFWWGKMISLSFLTLVFSSCKG